MSEPLPGGRSPGKIANSLVALGSAAVLAVYSAGYLRTRAAADKLSAAERSRVVIPAAPSQSAPTPQPKPQYKDGTYSGWGTSRHGDIEATVTITAGRIVSAVISQCRTQYACSWVERLPDQIVARQGADVDYVSGATQSTNAFYYAVVQALAKAK